MREAGVKAREILENGIVLLWYTKGSDSGPRRMLIQCLAMPPGTPVPHQMDILPQVSVVLPVKWGASFYLKGLLWGQMR